MSFFGFLFKRKTIESALIVAFTGVLYVAIDYLNAPVEPDVAKQYYTVTQDQYGLHYALGVWLEYLGMIGAYLMFVLLVRGFNARMMLLSLVLATTTEWLTYDVLQGYFYENRIPLGVITVSMLTFLVSHVPVLYRASLARWLGATLLRKGNQYRLTRSAGMNLLFKTRTTRLDGYFAVFFIATLSLLAISLAPVLTLYVTLDYENGKDFFAQVNAKWWTVFIYESSFYMMQAVSAVFSVAIVYAAYLDQKKADILTFSEIDEPDADREAWLSTSYANGYSLLNLGHKKGR